MRIDYSKILPNVDLSKDLIEHKTLFSEVERFFIDMGFTVLMYMILF